MKLGVGAGDEMGARRWIEEALGKSKVVKFKVVQALSMLSTRTWHWGVGRGVDKDKGMLRQATQKGKHSSQHGGCHEGAHRWGTWRAGAHGGRGRMEGGGAWRAGYMEGGGAWRAGVHGGSLSSDVMPL